MSARTWVVGVWLLAASLAGCAREAEGGCPDLACPAACPAGFRYDPQTHCRTCECWPECTTGAPTCAQVCTLGQARDPATGCLTCECCHPADCVTGCHGAQDEKGCPACGPCD